VVTSFQHITYDASVTASATKVFWFPWRREIFIDLDGTLTGTNVKTYITPYYPHFDADITSGDCTKDVS
jgi:hypothetical protein